MVKEKKMEFNTDWYESWMKQSKEFFDSANKNVKNVFPQDGFTTPDENLKQMNQWVEMLKKQWQMTQLMEQQKAFEAYLKMTTKMCNESADMLLEQWIKRSKEKNPVKSMQDLYELWVDCCKEIYKKSMTSKDFQQLYDQYMNAMLQFWKSAMPK